MDDLRKVKGIGRDKAVTLLAAFTLAHKMAEELQHELKRIGIELEHPTDLYKYEEKDNGSYLRIVYHAVGKILSGPNQWKEHPGLGETLMYHTVRKSPFASVVVFPQNQSFDAAPVLKDESAGDLIRIDFRLFVPSK